MKSTTPHQDLDLPADGLEGRLSSRPGVAAREPPLRSCLALLAAWLAAFRRNYRGGGALRRLAGCAGEARLRGERGVKQ